MCWEKYLDLEQERLAERETPEQPAETEPLASEKLEPERELVEV